MNLLETSRNGHRYQAAEADRKRTHANSLLMEAGVHHARSQASLVRLNALLLGAGFDIDDVVEIAGHRYQVADCPDDEPGPAKYLGLDLPGDNDVDGSIEDEIAEHRRDYYAAVLPTF
jgi:hypothetical protein